MHIYDNLTEANKARQTAWLADGAPTVDLSFRVIELVGEMGEAMNIVKKLLREEKGWRGSRATPAELATELADIMIVCDLIRIDTTGQTDMTLLALVGRSISDLALGLARLVGAVADCCQHYQVNKYGLDECLSWVIAYTKAIAHHYKIDLPRAIALKFNETSEKVGLPQRMVVEDTFS